MYEVEQYKAENRDLQNQLKLMTEEQETLAMQLEQTGHVLDEANAEIREKEEEIKRMQALLVGREHEVEDLMAQRELLPCSLSLSLLTSLSLTLPPPPPPLFLTHSLTHSFIHSLSHTAPFFVHISVAEAEVVREKLNTLEHELESAQ